MFYHVLPGFFSDFEVVSSGLLMVSSIFFGVFKMFLMVLDQFHMVNKVPKDQKWGMKPVLSATRTSCGSGFTA